MVREYQGKTLFNGLGSLTAGPFEMDEPGLALSQTFFSTWSTILDLQQH